MNEVDSETDVQINGIGHKNDRNTQDERSK